MCILQESYKVTMMKGTFFFYTNEFIIFAGVTHEKKKKVFKWGAAAWG